MRRFIRWLNKRFGTFDLLPEYFTAAASQMQNILWGALLPFLAWGIWFIVSTPPTWVNLLAVGFALFLAGYYVWRADHLRLLQKIEITRLRVQSWVVDGREGRAHYFEVLNTSEALSIHGIRVELEAMKPEVDNLDWLPVPLQQKHDNPPHGIPHARTFDLNPGEHKDIDLVSSFTGDKFFTIHHIVGHGVNQRVPASGKHLLKVLVTAQGKSSARAVRCGSQFFSVNQETVKNKRSAVLRVAKLANMISQLSRVAK